MSDWIVFSCWVSRVVRFFDVQYLFNMLCFVKHDEIYGVSDFFPPFEKILVFHKYLTSVFGYYIANQAVGARHLELFGLGSACNPLNLRCFSALMGTPQMLGRCSMSLNICPVDRFLKEF